MKLRVWGAMHPPEPLGGEIVASLESDPILGVDAGTANERATGRWLHQDLNRSFPGDIDSPLYEVQRAVEVLTASQGYDLVLDFHNTLCPDNDCVFLGVDADPRLYDLASYLGLNRVIVADYDCINKYLSNCLSIEISLDSPRMSVNYWRQVLSDLARRDTLPAARPLAKYRYVYTLTNDDRDRLHLPERGLKVFEALPADITDALSLPYPAYPIFLGPNYTPGVYGGVLTRIDN